MTQENTPLTLTITALATGFYLNALGWLGNAVLLHEDWKAAYELTGPFLDLPYTALIKELLTLLPDFAYAFALVWLYAAAGPRHPAPRRFALELVVVMWAVTVAVTYLALVNSGFLPADIAVKTGLWALVTFLPLAVFLPLVLRTRRDDAGPPVQP